MSADAEYSLVAPFLTDDPKFALGVEYGIVYGQLRAGVVTYAGAVHEENEERLLVLARRLGYAATVSRLGEGWLDMAFRRMDVPPSQEEDPRCG